MTTTISKITTTTTTTTNDMEEEEEILEKCDIKFTFKNNVGYVLRNIDICNSMLMLKIRIGKLVDESPQNLVITLETGDIVGDHAYVAAIVKRVLNVQVKNFQEPIDEPSDAGPTINANVFEVPSYEDDMADYDYPRMTMPPGSQLPQQSHLFGNISPPPFIPSQTNTVQSDSGNPVPMETGDDKVGGVVERSIKELNATLNSYQSNYFQRNNRNWNSQPGFAPNSFTDGPTSNTSNGFMSGTTGTSTSSFSNGGFAFDATNRRGDTRFVTTITPISGTDTPSYSSRRNSTYLPHTGGGSVNAFTNSSSNTTT